MSFRFLPALRTVSLLLGLVVIAAGCAQSAPAPTSASTAPAQAAPTQAVAAAPAVPASAPVAASAPTAVPAKKVDFPDKGRSISIIVPFAAGGGTDVAVRLLAPSLEKELGVPVQVVNKGGAGTQTGNTELAKAKPDGYTIGVASFAAILVTYLDPDRKAVYTRKDFTPIAHMVKDDNAILVKADSPFKTVKDVVDAAKAHPGSVKVGDTAIMSNTHLAMIQLENVANARFAFVHFDGTGPGMTALLGGHIDVLASSAGGIISQYKGGAVRVLATTGKDESPFLNGVKTLAEQGYDVKTAYTYGLAGPAGLPRDIANVLSGAVKKSLESADIQKRLQEVALASWYMGPDEFEAYWADYENQVKPLIDLAKRTQ